MKRIEDAPKELQGTMVLAAESSKMHDILEAIWQLYETDAEVSKAHFRTAEYFFYEGINAAIAERAKFDEQNGLLVKDITEL